MKSFTKILLLAGALGAAAFPLAHADDAAPPPPPDHGPGHGPGHGGSVAHRVNALKNRLNLTDAQASQVQAIMSAARAKMDALRDAAADAEDDQRTQGRAIHQASRAQIRALLTPDQQKLFDQMKPRGPGHRHPPGNQGATPPPPPPASS